jgi:hypothetical protein
VHSTERLYVQHARAKSVAELDPRAEPDFYADSDRDPYTDALADACRRGAKAEGHAATDVNE